MYTNSSVPPSQTCYYPGDNFSLQGFPILPGEEPGGNEKILRGGLTYLVRPAKIRAVAHLLLWRESAGRTVAPVRGVVRWAVLVYIGFFQGPWHFPFAAMALILWRSRREGFSPPTGTESARAFHSPSFRKAGASCHVLPRRWASRVGIVWFVVQSLGLKLLRDMRAP